MGRRLRVLPSNKLIHATNKCADSQFILAPNPDACVIHEFHEILKTAKHRYDVFIYCVILMSNHIHILFKAPNGNGSNFMGHIQSQLAKRINKRRNRKSSVFPNRFEHTIVGNTPESHLTCLTYIILNGVKARLVDHPDDWPGYLSHAS